MFYSCMVRFCARRQACENENDMEKSEASQEALVEPLVDLGQKQ